MAIFYSLSKAKVKAKDGLALRYLHYTSKLSIASVRAYPTYSEETGCGSVISKISLFLHVAVVCWFLPDLIQPHSRTRSA